MIMANPIARIARIALIILLLALSACAIRPPVQPSSSEPRPLEHMYYSEHPSRSPDFDGWSCTVIPQATAVTEIGIERIGGCRGILVPRGGRKKTPFYAIGPCAAYTVIIRADGTVHYEGYENVPTVGSRTGRTSSEQFQKLARLVDEIGFARMPHEYYCPVTDGEVVFVSVVSSGTRKSIKHYGNEDTASALFLILEQAIDRVANDATTWP